MSNPNNWWGSNYRRKLADNGVPNDVEATGIFTCAARPSPQVAALGQWLLEVSRSLLDPRDAVQQSPLGRGSLRLASISQNNANFGAESPSRTESAASAYDLGSWSEVQVLAGEGATSRSKLGWQPLSSAQRFDYFVHKVCLTSAAGPRWIPSHLDSSDNDLLCLAIVQPQALMRVSITNAGLQSSALAR